ncbi:MAG: acetylglutamate kinase [Candidatus Tectimicrobiota bacterium]
MPAISAHQKAAILIEALPYFRRFFGKTMVIKYGGAAMVKEELKEAFATDVILLQTVGINPVVVHGGGPQIGQLMKQLGMEPRFVEGLRVTDEETMNVVEMVLVGQVNKAIVATINTYGGNAVGLSGKDGGLIRARKLALTRPTEEAGPPEIIDLGRVGEVEAINPEVLQALEGSRFIPVVAPVGVGKDGEAFNINADHVASALAVALKAERLILLSDIEGVLGRDGTLLSTLTRAESERLIADGIIAAGMVPKVKACLDALSDGVPKTHIIDGRTPHSLVLELFTDAGIGTEILDKLPGP